MDNELILFDRLEVIKSTIQKYGEDNFYISFSGGKDSTVLHHLVDMALPNNKIPRVYSNTGIEYLKVVDFVKKLAEKDDRIIILKPTTNIKKTLEEKGYPFKSKEYSNWLAMYQKYPEENDKYFAMIKKDKSLLDNYDFIHNLPKGVKMVIKSFYGIRERERESCIATHRVPNILKYQFSQDFKLKISDNCCLEMKEKPLHKWSKENNKPNTIIGIMVDEGGRRSIHGKCISFRNNNVSFAPLIKVTKEWEQWFIDKYNIELCELYYPPFSFERTGCKGCPFAIKLQDSLDTLQKFFPNERKQCEIIWKPIYEEYRRINYRLKKNEQIDLFE